VEVEQAYSTLFTRNDPVIELAAKVSQTMPVGLATNTDPSHLLRVQQDYPDLWSLFGEERTVASSACGHRKPSRAFFECLIESSGYPAGQLCFIDDLPANIAAASDAGLQTIHFANNAKQLSEELTTLLVR
jgi:HAD superfamily hydrolase (TIGR01509 family)